MTRLPLALPFVSSMFTLAPVVACGSSADVGTPERPPRDRGVVLAPVSTSDGGAPDEAPPCTGDADCAASDLCVGGACRRACHDDRGCVVGSCHTETAGGWCYNAPGCNPPPPGTACPMLCYGYCM